MSVGLDSDEELINEWEGLEDVDFDPFDSPKELLACCVSIIVKNSNLPLHLRREK